MALATNSKNLRIDAGGRLSGETKRSDGSWAFHSKIDLNEKLGNDDGQFMFVESRYNGFNTDNARDFKVEGTTLRAQLKNRGRTFVEASIDLARVIKVTDGEFAFMSKVERELVGKRSIAATLPTNSKNLRIDAGGRLYGETKRSNGSWATHSTIDLNEKLGNDDGQFMFVESRYNGFNTDNARNLKLEGTTLRAQLKNRGRNFVEASIDLARVIKVTDGEFAFMTKQEREEGISAGDEDRDPITDLSANSKSLSVDQTWLSGQVKTNSGSWRGDRIDLTNKLGNHNGQFDIEHTNFAETARDTKVEGTILLAKLRREYQYVEAAFDLADLLMVVDGSFFFRSEYNTDSPETERSLVHYSRDLRVDSNGQFSGEIQGRDGSWTRHSINLNEKIGNRDGVFDLHGSYFSTSAQLVRSQGTRLWAELKTEEQGIKKDSIDLNGILEVLNGSFRFKEDFERQREEVKKVLDSLQGLPGDSRNLWINKAGLLSGATRREDDTWTSDFISLNRYLGNERGQFHLDSRNFANSSGKFKLRGTKLTAELSIGSDSPVEASIDLALVLRVNEKGQFVFISPHERKRIISSAFCMFLEKESGRIELHGLCLDKHGKLQGSSIDLNRYYKNDNGSFASNDYGRPQNLLDDINHKVDVTPANIYLRATLRQRSGGGEDQSVDLNINIENDDGRFKFVKHDGPFHRDGYITKKAEGLPIIGYITALAHLGAGNHEWAKRAAAASTNALIVWVGVTVGSAIGGPLGASIGAGIATAIGIAVETEIKKGIRDKGLQAEFEEATVGRYLTETFTAMLSTGGTKTFSKWIGKIPPEKFSSTSKMLGKAMHKAVKEAGTREIKNMTEKLGEAINGQFPEDWRRTLDKVDKY